MNLSSPIIIAGGGIAGLTAAWNLHKMNIPFLLLEQSDRVGGMMQSEHIAGFTIERGPNTVSMTPALQQLVEELHLQDEVLEAAPAGKNRYLLRNGQLCSLSPHPLKILTNPYLSVEAKWKLFTERFVPPEQKEEEESVAVFFERRFGREIAASVIDPVLSGIYAGDITRLSIQEVMPALPGWEKEFGSVTKGLMRRKGALGGRKTISFKGGFATLADAIYQQLGDKVLLRTAIQGVRRENEGFEVAFLQDEVPDTIHAEKIICTLPAYAAAGMTELLDPSLSLTLREIIYPEVWELQVGFEKQEIGRPLDGFGFLVARRENKSFLGCIFTSSLFPSKAPEGKVLFTVFIGGALQQPLVKAADAATVTGRVIKELREILQISGDCCFKQLQVWDRAIPQLNTGYGRMRAAWTTFEQQHPGFYFGGNYVAGVAVGDVIRHATGLAARCVQ